MGGTFTLKSANPAGKMGVSLKELVLLPSCLRCWVLAPLPFTYLRLGIRRGLGNDWAQLDTYPHPFTPLGDAQNNFGLLQIRRCVYTSYMGVLTLGRSVACC